MEREIAPGRADGWIETEATIVRCRRTFLSGVRGSGNAGDSLYEAPEYTIRFQYSVCDKQYTGTYVAHSKQDVGSRLTIAYDPKRPERNTGSDLFQNPILRLIVWLIGLGLVALAAWLGFLDRPPL